MEDFYPRKVSDLLSKVLNPEVLADTEGLIRFFTSWTEIAGDVLASHTKPVDIRNGIIYIDAEHPGWVQHLQLNQTSILKKIQQKFPELNIRGIAFRLKRDESLPGILVAKLKPEGQSLRNNTDIQDIEGQSYNENLDKPEMEGQSSKKNIKDVIDEIKDESFKEVLSSLAKTLEKNAKAENKKIK